MLVDGINGVKTLLQYNSLKDYQKRLNLSLTDSEGSYMKMNTLQYLCNLLIALIAGVGTFIPLRIGGYFVLNGSLMAGGLIAIFLASDRILSPLSEMVQYYNKIQTTNQTRQKVKAMQAESEQADQKVYPTLPNEALYPICLRDIRVRFDDKTQIALNHLTIEKGSKTLLKGKSGSGKTTLLRVLMGQVKPT